MSKQLLQQALDYVENVPDDRCWGDYRDHQALEEALRAAIAVPEAEPVYQYQLANGNWIDQAKESYDYNVRHGQATIRALYTSPPDTEALRKELERVKGERDAMLDLLRSDKMLTAIVRMINPAVFGTTPINDLGQETPNRIGLLESAKFLHSLRGSDTDFEDEHKWLLGLVKTHPNFKDDAAIAAQGGGA